MRIEGLRKHCYSEWGRVGVDRLWKDDSINLNKRISCIKSNDFDVTLKL